MTTRRTLLRATVCIGFAGLAGAGATAAAGPASAHAVDRRALREALDQIVASGSIGAVAEVRDAAGFWRASSGSARFGSERPVPVNGRFRVGSVTKTFVATVVLQLVGAGRLRLDDTVERWLPGHIPAGGQVTIRHLLQHTSGVYNYTDDLFTSVEELLAQRFRTYRPRELVAIAADRPLLFEPGTSWSYSNTNYVLLGLVIERVTGRPYGAEVSRRIIRPLGLDGTRVPGTDPFIHGPHAHAYVPVEQDGALVPVDITAWNPSAAYAAGEIVSTTADLNRFYRALLGGRLLAPAQLNQMIGNPVGDLEYGLGIFRLVLPNGTVLWGHDGGIPSYLTFAMSTEDGGAQLSLSITPWSGDPSDALLSLIFAAFGVEPAMATRAARFPRLDRPSWIR